MERVKSKGRNDEFAATKAAAWAWYQRGSGSEGKPMSEFEARRSRPSPVPSRYKLEANEAEKQATKPKLRSTSPLAIPSQSGLDKSHLLDKYEIERISKQLHHYTATGERFLAGEGTNDRKVTGGGGKKKNDKTKMSKSTTKGLWWLRPHGMVITCGTSRNDVVELTRGFRPEKPAATVVGAAKLRPRRTHAA